MNVQSVPDVDVLGQILLLQSSLSTQQSQKQLGEFLDEGLRRVPGVQGLVLCVNGKHFGSSELAGCEIPLDCPQSQTENGPYDYGPEKCSVALPEGRQRRILLKTEQGTLGSVLFSIDEPEAFETYASFIGNTVDLVAILLENRIQKEVLETSEIKFRSLVASSPVCIHEIDLDGKLLSMNEAGLKMMGVDHESAIRGLDYLGIPIPEDRERVTALMNRALTGVSMMFEFSADGDTGRIHFQSSFAPIRSESGAIVKLMGVTQDVTERKIAEEKFLTSEEKYRTILTNIEEAYYEVDLQGNFTDFNESARKTLGYSHEEMMGMNNRQYMDQENARALFRTFNDVFLSRSPAKAPEWNVIKKDGTTGIIRGSVSPVLNSDGQHIGFRGIFTEITEQKKAEAALRKSEERMRETQHIARLGSFAGTIAEDELVWSDELYRIFGLKQDTYKATKDRFIELLHPDDQEEYLSALARSLETGERLVQSFRGKHKNGQWRQYQTIASVTCDSQGEITGLQGTVQDVTDQMTAEADKEEYYARSVGVIKNSADAIITVDEQGIIESINPAAETLFGYNETDLIGRNSSILLSEFSRETQNSFLDLPYSKEGGPSAHTVREVDAVRHDGKPFPVRLGISEVTFHNKRIFAWTIHDLTQVTQLEQQLMQAQKLESLGTLASGIAHDLNNILAPISMSSAVLRKDGLSERSLRVLGTIEEAASRGADIVKQVLTFARAKDGVKTRVSVTNTIDEVMKFAKETFPKNVRLRADVPEELWNIYGDPTQLHQILMNLAVNGRDAMPGGGSLRIHAKDITLDDSYSAMNIDAHAGPYVVIEITDSGVGISEDNLLRIFDPFFTTKEIGKGTGLGLATVAGIVKGFDGFLNTDSVIGKGTCFSIYLPAILEEQSTPFDDTEEFPVAEGSGETILVVDDEESILEITVTTLESYKYKTLTATNGAEGISKFASHSNEISLVVTDIMMPHMDGTALVRAIRSLRPTIPIIATTGLKNDLKIDSELGISKILDKPHTAEELLHAIRETLDAPIT